MSEQLFDALTVLNALPGNHLILLPDAPAFTIVGVTDAYLQVTYTQRETVLGKGVFEALPDDAENPAATGVANLSASLQQVITHKRPHRMNYQRYDVFHPQAGVFVHKVWEPVNQPVLSPDGALQYIIHTVEDVTEQVYLRQENLRARQHLSESENRFRQTLEQAPVAMALLSGPQFVITLANDRVLHYWGRTHQEVIGRPVFEALPETSGQGFEELLMNVYTTGERFIANELAVQLERNGHLEQTYIDFIYEPFREPNGVISGVTVVCVEITGQVLARRQVEANEAYFRQLTDTLPAILWTTDPDGHCSYLNRQWYDYTGQTPDQAEGFGWLDAIHPEDMDATGRRFMAANEQHVSFYLLYRLRRHDGTYRWAIDKGSPHFDADGRYLGMIGTVLDVHEQRLAEEAMQASENKLRSIIATAPAAMGLFVGRELIVELPNQAFIDIVGKGPAIEGKPLREVMPELVTENQPFLQILDDVFTSGRMFQSYGSLVQIVQNGVMTNNYYNITYTPLRDETGQVYAILDIAIDVTPEIKARQKLQETEATLRGAIEVAEMGTWELDMTTGVTTYSERLKRLFEFSQDSLELDHLYNRILKADRPRLVKAVARAADPESEGLLDEEYTISTQQTGRHRIVRAQAKMYFDERGKPTKLVGSMRDITEQRQTQLALEQLVQQRTEELAAVNEEMAATNEELAEANGLLVRSNENLQTFAYVASHDLQEPLRKIQQFGDMLKTQYGDALGPGAGYLERMQSAAHRMSMLIRDLLNFSRISTQRDTSGPVALGSIVEQVLSTLELTIEETGAQIEIDALPILSGDSLQLGQLFQNLVSNALKFRRDDVPPQIAIRSAVVSVDELPASVKPTRKADHYYRIEVADNGIGFEEKYVDRIFQVFQRLHNRSKFVGTGIGLSICEKVATNHGGAITASSQPGEGTTFYVYLPA